MSLLQRLRASKTAVARVVAPLLAAVWLGAPAAACTGMLAALAPGEAAATHAEHIGSGEPHIADAHERADAPRGGSAHVPDMHGHSAHRASTAESAHAGHSEHGTVEADDASSGDSHDKCPWCPPGAGASHDGAHAGCTNLGGADALTAAGALKLDAKYAPAAGVTVALPLRAPLPSPLGGVAPLHHRSVPINIRNCVFLI